MNFILLIAFACSSEDTEKSDTSSEIQEESNNEESQETEENNNEENNNEENNNEERNNEERNNEETQNTDEVICSQISVDECSTFEECEVVSAYPIVLDENGNECVDYASQEAQACETFGCSAEPTITFAHPPDSDQCWMFASGCLPEGWSYCDTNADTCP